MTRQLRPRKSRPSYAALVEFEDGDDSEPQPTKKTTKAKATTKAVVVEEDSESDFAGGENEAAEDDEDAEVEDDVMEEDSEEEPERPAKRARVTQAKKKAATPKAKGKAKATPKPRAVSIQDAVAPSAARGSKRQMYVLPAPSVHHRHRAVPLYSRSGQAERLTSKPALFASSSQTLTNGFTHNSKITDRVNKAWGYNIGAGPLWDMAEDRGWFKEAITTGDDVDTEAKRRPMVYPDIPVMNGWTFLSKEEASPYLPTDDTTTEEGNLKPPPPVKCHFGPIDAQEKKELAIFDSLTLSPDCYVFNAGGPVWGLDWCPFYVEERSSRSYTQYLAVGPFPSHSHSPDIGRKVTRPSYACIQIWSLSSKEKPTRSKKPVPITGQMKCELILAIDSGPAFELKWCPLPSHDQFNGNKQIKKLGLLGGTFEDGTFAVYVVPDPTTLKPSKKTDSQPLYVKLQPILRIELEETSCWTFDWANSEVIAIGTTNGIISVFNLGSYLKNIVSAGNISSPIFCPLLTFPENCLLDVPTITNVLPTHYLSVHQSAIRALAWVKAPPALPSGLPSVGRSPTVIASGGYDGMECMTDIRSGHGSVMNRTRDVINALHYSPFAGGPITMDHENTVKAYSASPSMLGRGHSLLEPQGPVWSVHASDYHPQLAVGAADGSCSTTNTLRSTRRGGTVPFFVYKVFQMDYNRHTKEFRMLDHFLPQESVDRPSAARSAKDKGKDKDFYPPPSCGAWPPEVGVHRVVWNCGNGLASCGLLAAGTSSGLCRVDWVLGRWVKDKIPYGSVSSVRLEDAGSEDGMDVDSDASGEASE
ncbi:hypothetical protein CVT24_011803 [Panaeolus cyanescens]|uniref:Uncharacterized protein n=1 Tax=Panaeolus cyanescens TaxID=181874 RepID=A0A409VHB0_9AGAR|nr:hypothetical protein CVT24_011803 [Panaeolus cyanescens]